MVGMLMRHDDRSRVCERVLFGFVLSVLKAAWELRLEEGASGGSVDDDHRAVEIKDLVRRKNQLMTIETDAAEEDRGGRAGVRDFSGVDFDRMRARRLVGEFSQRREFDLVVRMIGNRRPLQQEHEGDQRDRHCRADNDTRDSQKAPHPDSLCVRSGDLCIGTIWPVWRKGTTSHPANARYIIAFHWFRGADA